MNGKIIQLILSFSKRRPPVYRWEVQIKEERLYAAVSQNFLNQAEVLSSNVEEKLEGEHLFVEEFITKNKLTEENKNLFW